MYYPEVAASNVGSSGEVVKSTANAAGLVWSNDASTLLVLQDNNTSDG